MIKTGVKQIKFKEKVAWILRRLPFSDLLLKRNTPLIVANYHVVSDYELPHLKHIYNFKNCAQFEHDIKTLLKFFDAVSLEEIMYCNDIQNDMRGKFFLTFDDGLREVFTKIEPILNYYNLKAAFFLNPTFINNRTMFYRHKISLIVNLLCSKKYDHHVIKNIAHLLDQNLICKGDLINRVKLIGYKEQSLTDKIGEILDFSFSKYLEENKPYMESSQIHELIKKGHYIGAHSLDHPIYSQIGFKNQISQTKDSIDLVVDEYNLPYRIFSIPHMDHGISNDFFVKILNDREDPVDLVFGNSNLKLERISKKVIHRIIGDNPNYDFEGFLKIHLLNYRINNLLKNKFTKRN